MNESQRIDKSIGERSNAQLPPIFLKYDTRDVRANEIEIPAAPQPPAAPGDPGQIPVIPLPPYVPNDPGQIPEIPLPPYVPGDPGQIPIIPLPPYVPSPPVPAPPTPAPPSNSERIAVNARYLLDYMALYLDYLKIAYDLSGGRPKEVRDEIKAIRNRAYILYDDAIQIVGRLPVALQNVNERVTVRTTQDALRQSLRFGKLDLRRIMNLIYLNGNRSIDFQLLSLYIRLNEDLNNITSLLTQLN